MFFSQKKKDLNTYFICDLGSSSVGGALITISRKGKAKVLWQERINLNLSPSGHRTDLALLTMCLKQLVESADSFLFKVHSLGDVKEVLISVSSPWYISRFKKEDIRKNDTFTVSSDHLKEIVQKAAQSLGVEIISQRDSQSQLFKSGSSVIEQQTMDLKINGYAIKNPIDIKARDLTISMMLSIIPQELGTFLGAVFDKYWSNVRYQIMSFPHSHFKALNYLRLDQEDQVLIDVTGMRTELTYIKKGAIAKISYLNMGKNDFINYLSEVLDTKPFIAESEFKLFVEGGSTTKQEADISFILAGIEKRWKTELLDLIEQDVDFKKKKYVLSVDPGNYNYFEGLFLQALREKRIEGNISVIPAIYEHSDIEYANNISRDVYLELGILSLLNSK